MKKDRFNDLLNHPSQINSAPDTELLKDIVSRYPYFQTAQVLLSVALSQVNSVFSPQSIKIASIYTGERSRLRKFIDTQTPYFEFEEVKNTKKPKSPVLEEKKNYKRPSELGIQPKSKHKKESVDSILEKFIEEAPKISKPKSEFYNPANMAAKSIEEDESLVSETLAKIYLKQGNIEKAIECFEKLSLIYPNKSEYFADLIKKANSKD